MYLPRVQHGAFVVPLQPSTVCTAFCSLLLRHVPSSIRGQPKYLPLLYSSCTTAHFCWVRNAHLLSHRSTGLLRLQYTSATLVQSVRVPWSVAYARQVSAGRSDRVSQIWGTRPRICCSATLSMGACRFCYPATFTSQGFPVSLAVVSAARLGPRAFVLGWAGRASEWGPPRAVHWYITTEYITTVCAATTG